MNKLLSTVAIAALALIGSTAAQAGTFSPSFSDYAFPGSQYTVDSGANAYYSANYGITVSNAYLYKDSRDTFDGVGIANGTVAEIGTTQAGRIDFIDTTNFVTIDYLSILPTVYSAFSSGGTLLGTFSAPGDNSTGTFTLTGGSEYISYLTFTSTGGYGTVSGLTYDYDGTTGGGNTDLTPPVPEPETYALMLLGLGFIGVAVRRRTQA